MGPTTSDTTPTEDYRPDFRRGIFTQTVELAESLLRRLLRSNWNVRRALFFRSFRPLAPAPSSIGNLKADWSGMWQPSHTECDLLQEVMVIPFRNPMDRLRTLSAAGGSDDVHDYPLRHFLVVVFDEAANLFTSSGDLRNSALRRIMRHLMDRPVCFLFMSTNSQISKFAPVIREDPSARISSGSLAHLEPFLGLELDLVAQERLRTGNPICNYRFRWRCCQQRPGV